MSLAVSLDGTDVSGVAIEGSSTRRLNRVSQAQIKIPMDAAIGGAGSALKISFNGNLHHHGRVLSCETDTGEDEGFTVYNSSDPMELWQWRPARDGPSSADPGDMTLPTFIQDFITGPQIMEQLFLASEDVTLIPSLAEGPLFLDFGSFAVGGNSLTGMPTDWPMTIAEVATLLTSTGELDIVITPTDPGGGIMGTVDCYNGDYGTNLSPYGGGSGAVHFQYGTGAKNVRRLRWNEDMTNVCNKLWYFAGPRLETASDPAGEQHWCWNITGDDCCFTGVPGPFCTCTSPSEADMVAKFANVDACRDASRAAVGVRMEVQIFDALSERCLGEGAVDPGRDLYRYLWLAESWLRCQTRELIHITPIRGTEIDTFDIGDLVGVEIGSQIRGGTSGAQRVYEYTISWDEDGPFELSELQTSSDLGVGA